ncbi:hypothetical protein HPB52_004967 [Rhipicephalus sanguineus]|uniref:Uncharacterized protein n=1 Tax=Rhipicephalus sanguineus TaxID=34632 RepID=A0A9D4PNR7_RHISA|nr:hypothetical protein HPB52_004967 [Rhipicephalus sanguineus]
MISRSLKSGADGAVAVEAAVGEAVMRFNLGTHNASSSILRELQVEQTAKLTLRLYDDAENIVQGDGVRCVVSIAYVSGIQVWNGGRAWLCGPLIVVLVGIRVRRRLRHVSHSWTPSLWWQKRAELAKASAKRCTKAPRTRPEVTKRPLLVRASEEPSGTPKGGLQSAARASPAQPAPPPLSSQDPEIDTDTESRDSWTPSLWRQKRAALVKAPAKRSTKAPRTRPEVTKRPLLVRASEESSEAAKGGLQNEARASVVQPPPRPVSFQDSEIDEDTDSTGTNSWTPSLSRQKWAVLPKAAAKRSKKAPSTTPPEVSKRPLIETSDVT